MPFQTRRTVYGGDSLWNSHAESEYLQHSVDPPPLRQSTRAIKRVSFDLHGSHIPYSRSELRADQDRETEMVKQAAAKQREEARAAKRAEKIANEKAKAARDAEKRAQRIANMEAESSAKAAKSNGRSKGKARATQSKVSR